MQGMQGKSWRCDLPLHPRVPSRLGGASRGLTREAVKYTAGMAKTFVLYGPRLSHVMLRKTA